MIPIPEGELVRMIRDAFATQKRSDEPEPPEVPDKPSED